MHCLDVVFAFVFSVDQDIIQIHNNEDIKLFRKNFIDIALEYCQNIGQSKRYYLILKVTVFGPESRFSLIFFANSHLVIDTDKIKLGKPPSFPQSI